jgi:hypothetical protein
MSEDEFTVLLSMTGIYTDVEDHSFRLLTMIDPYNNKQITFSECVSVFSMEILEEDGGQISLLDKICFDEQILK